MAEFAAVLGQPLVLDAPDAERVTDVWTVRVDAAARCARLEADLIDRSLVMTVADPTQLGAGVHSRRHPRWDRCLARRRSAARPPHVDDDRDWLGLVGASPQHHELVAGRRFMMMTTPTRQFTARTPVGTTRTWLERETTRESVSVTGSQITIRQFTPDVPQRLRDALVGHTPERSRTECGSPSAPRSPTHTRRPADRVPRHSMKQSVRRFPMNGRSARVCTTVGVENRRRRGDLESSPARHLRLRRCAMDSHLVSVGYEGRDVAERHRRRHRSSSHWSTRGCPP